MLYFDLLLEETPEGFYIESSQIDGPFICKTKREAIEKSINFLKNLLKPEDQDEENE